MGLDDQQAVAHARDALEREPRVLEVVEHAEEEHDVEAADRRGRDLLELELPVLHAEPSARRASRSRLRAEAARPPGGLAPGRPVDGEHPLGAAPLGLEGEEPVPGPDVEHRAPAQVVGEADPAELARGLVAPRRDDAAAEVDRVEPALAGDGRRAGRRRGRSSRAAYARAVGETIPELFEAAAAAVPEQPWLVTDAGEFTYAQARERIRRAAAALAERGVGARRPRAVDRAATRPTTCSPGSRRCTSARSRRGQPEEQRGRARGPDRAGRAGGDARRSTTSTRCSPATAALDGARPGAGPTTPRC